MAGKPTITKEELLNQKFGPVSYDIEKWWVKKFVEAVDDPNPAWQKVTPPTFATALILEDMHDAIVNYGDYKASLNGGNELEYFKPIKIGDTITVTGKITAMKERPGKLGTMVIIISEASYTNQNKELVAKCRSTSIKY
ncbi:MAG: MaoC family dehydratase N-terminal domain-containing protein [Dehalococcoidales bacterium]|nr:MaoC family dehydratase N-terminal domain-containing protein [Dehalococcoidales bacterium]